MQKKILLEFVCDQFHALIKKVFFSFLHGYSCFFFAYVTKYSLQSLVRGQEKKKQDRSEGNAN